MSTNPQTEQLDPELHNPVSSFEVGIITKRGAWVGICIKFAMYDRTTKITHWSPPAYRALFEALEQYCQHLGSNAFMFRAEADVSLVAGLPARHPYHTLLDEAPQLTEEEIGTASLHTGINAATFAVRGPTIELRPEFGDGRNESIYLHEYTALSLLGYLGEYNDAIETLTTPAAGNA